MPPTELLPLFSKVPSVELRSKMVVPDLEQVDLGGAVFFSHSFVFDVICDNK
jgi:hypothetical protein